MVLSGAQEVKNICGLKTKKLIYIMFNDYGGAPNRIQVNPKDIASRNR